MVFLPENIARGVCLPALAVIATLLAPGGASTASGASAASEHGLAGLCSSRNFDHLKKKATSSLLVADATLDRDRNLPGYEPFGRSLKAIDVGRDQTEIKYKLDAVLTYLDRLGSSRNVYMLTFELCDITIDTRPCRNANYYAFLGVNSDIVDETLKDILTGDSDIEPCRGTRLYGIGGWG